MQEKVYILMATYNGEKFLSEQLDSILQQSYDNWELIIRDDYSTDNTIDIITDYVSKDERIKLFKDELKNLGVVKNFNTLLENLDENAEYVMFCDQDDVWLPNKIELTLHTMKKFEHSIHMPILVYSRFSIVDENLNPISSNSYELPSKVTINTVLPQNFIHGCTMMLNKSLIELSIPISPKAENHDYWISLIASLYGKVHLLDEVTTLYRQHDNTVTGGLRNSTLSNKLTRFLRGNYYSMFHQRMNMIDDLIVHLQNKNKSTTFLEDYKKSIEIGKLTSTLFIMKNKIYRVDSGLLGNLTNIILSYNYAKKYSNGK